MKILLDTHVFIWWDSDVTRISPTAMAAIQDRNNSLFLSPVSVWEMAIKSQLGKLQLSLPLSEMVSQQQANGILELPVTLSHAMALEQLPPIHKDPFDRLLIAQAKAEGAELISADHIFWQYPVRTIW